MFSKKVKHSFAPVRAGETSVGQTAADFERARDYVAKQRRPLIAMSPPILAAVDELREFLFQSVYSEAIAKDETVKARKVLRLLYQHFRENPDQLPAELRESGRRDTVEQMVCDYVSGMTDHYALRKFEELYIPRLWTAWI